MKSEAVVIAIPDPFIPFNEIVCRLSFLSAKEQMAFTCGWAAYSITNSERFRIFKTLKLRAKIAFNRERRERDGENILIQSFMRSSLLLYEA
jgi:hypothetical protein